LREDVTHKIAAQMAMELSRTGLQTCAACAIQMAKQRSIPKEASREKATIFNGRVGHNLLKIKALEGMEVTINKSNWHIMVNKPTGFKRSHSLKPKLESLNTCVKQCIPRLYKGIQSKFCTKIMQERTLSWSRRQRARTGS
jgi:hypothetical protein